MFFHPEYHKKILEKFNEANYFDKPHEVLLLERKLDNLLISKSIPEFQIQHLLTPSQLHFNKNNPNSMNPSQTAN